MAKVTRINLNSFGVAPITTPGVALKPAAYARPVAKRVDLTKFNVPMIVSRSPQYNAPKPTLPKNALQGAMAASQSDFTKAIRDYNTPSTWHASQAESDKLLALTKESTERYKNQPKWAPYADAMDNVNMAFGDGTYTPSQNLGVTTLKFIGTLAKVAVGAAVIGMQVAGALNTVSKNMEWNKYLADSATKVQENYAAVQEYDATLRAVARGDAFMKGSGGNLLFSSKLVQPVADAGHMMSTGLSVPEEAVNALGTQPVEAAAKGTPFKIENVTDFYKSMTNLLKSASPYWGGPVPEGTMVVPAGAFNGIVEANPQIFTAPSTTITPSTSQIISQLTSSLAGNTPTPAIPMPAAQQPAAPMAGTTQQGNNPTLGNTTNVPRPTVTIIRNGTVQDVSDKMEQYIPTDNYEHFGAGLVSAFVKTPNGTNMVLRWGEKGAEGTVTATYPHSGTTSPAGIPSTLANSYNSDRYKKWGYKENPIVPTFKSMDEPTATVNAEHGEYDVVSVTTTVPDDASPQVKAANKAAIAARAKVMREKSYKGIGYIETRGMFSEKDNPIPKDDEEIDFLVPHSVGREEAIANNQMSRLVVSGGKANVIRTKDGGVDMPFSKMVVDPTLTNFYTKIPTKDGFILTAWQDPGANESTIAAGQSEVNATMAASPKDLAIQNMTSIGNVFSGTSGNGNPGSVANAAANYYNNVANDKTLAASVSPEDAIIQKGKKLKSTPPVYVKGGYIVVSGDGNPLVAISDFLNLPRHYTSVLLDTARHGGIDFVVKDNPAWMATGQPPAVIQNKLDSGQAVVKILATLPGSKIPGTDLTRIWTSLANNPLFKDTIKANYPDMNARLQEASAKKNIEIAAQNDEIKKWNTDHPTEKKRLKLSKPIFTTGVTKDDGVILEKVAHDISSPEGLASLGDVFAIQIVAKDGISNYHDWQWKKTSLPAVQTYHTILSGVTVVLDAETRIKIRSLVASEVATHPKPGIAPEKSAMAFFDPRMAQTMPFHEDSPAVKALYDFLVNVFTEYSQKAGLGTPNVTTNQTSSAAPVTVSNYATQYGGQQQSGTRVDPSQFHEEPPVEQVVSAINGSLRPGYLNITSVAHVLNTPARTLNQLLNNDPLKIGLDKLGAYDLLYGKETNAELRLGQGNPSVWNLGFVPATVKSVMLWGELFSAPTRMTFKDISVEADLQRSGLIKYDRAVAGLSKDEFVQLMWNVKRGGSGMLPVQQPTTLTKTQELADQYIAISKRAQGNLIAAGLDPQIFARLQGHYLPAPSDELGQDILSTIDEKITVKPSLGFIEKQKLPQDVIIGMASKDDTWQDYRDYMVARMASEIRAGEKGRFFGAIAADPHTNAIALNSIDVNTGKKIVVPKNYVPFSLGGEKKSFALDGYAVPKWVALFIKNEFVSASVMEQMKGIQEVIGQWKWNKAIANIPTFVRNVISQLTFQSLEAGMSVANLDDYLIRPLGALFGLNKVDQKTLVNLGIIDSGMIRDLEGLGFSPQERALWQSGQDRGLKIGMVYDKLKTARNFVSTVYAFSDNLTKAGAYFTAARNFDPRTARVLSSLTTGDYSQRPPIINYLTRGIYNGHINPFAMVFSSPFAFFKLVVEAQRAGNLVRYHPTLLVAGLLAAAAGIKGLIKKLQREYGMSEAAATALVNQFENYYWLNGKYVIPTGKNEGIDVTTMIPMLNFITEAKKALIAEKTLSQILATANTLLTGVSSANFIIETMVSLATGNDLNYFLQYGVLKSIGKTTVEQLLWLAGQSSPTWMSKLFIKKPNGKPFSLADLIGQYGITLTEADKNKAWSYIKSDPNITVAEKKRTAAAFFGKNSIEQIGWDRIMNSDEGK